MSAHFKFLRPHAQRLLADMAEWVVDASALVDVSLGNAMGRSVRRRIAGSELQAPAHLDADVLSSLGRRPRAEDLGDDGVAKSMRSLAIASIERHPVAELLIGACSRRDRLRLVDAVYLELAQMLRIPLVTTDGKLHSEPSAEVIDV